VAQASLGLECKRRDWAGVPMHRPGRSVTSVNPFCLQWQYYALSPRLRQNGYLKAFTSHQHHMHQAPPA